MDGWTDRHTDSTETDRQTDRQRDKHRYMYVRMSISFWNTGKLKTMTNCLSHGLKYL